MSFGGGAPMVTREERLAGVKIQTSTYGVPIPIYYGTNRMSPNIVWHNDFQAIEHTSTKSAGGKGGGGGATTTTISYTYNTGLMLALGEGQITVSSVMPDKDGWKSPASLGLEAFNGSEAQAVWGHLTAKHPDQAINYSGTAMLVASAYELGGTTSIPMFSVIGTGAAASTLGGAITDFLTNLRYGSNFPASRLAGLAAVDAYLAGLGISFSPFAVAQQPAAAYLKEWTDMANTAMVPSDGKLKFVPYYDSAVPEYDLGVDDFVVGEGEPPVRFSRKAADDCYNVQEVEYLDADHEYNAVPYEAYDQADIDENGPRPATPEKYHAIKSRAVASWVAHHRMQRKLYVKGEYRFKLDLRYGRLEPMDVVRLTEPRLGLDLFPVQIREIEEGEEGDLEVIADPYIGSVVGAKSYASQAAAGTTLAYGVAPGSVNAPVVFSAPGILTVTGHELWLAVSGSDSNWGGCEVWVSEDDLTYKKAGIIYGRARHGVLSAGLAAGADPDTVNTLSVDLTASLGELIGGTTEDADSLNTLCWIEGELLSFRDATLTAANKYNLTYLRRGAYNSISGAHGMGSRFVRIDQAVFRYAYDPALKGKSLYIKLPSFNKYGSALQSLGDVPAYVHTIGPGCSYPNNPTGFSASQNKNVVVFQWATGTNPNLAGADIRYNELGNLDWNSASPITQVTKGTQITTGRVPPGSWTFLLAHIDNSGNYSRTPARFDMTVANTFDLISQVEQAPDWPGTLTGFVKHWTGVLIPQSQSQAASLGWELFDQLVPNPVPVCTYESPEIDIGFDAADRIWGDIVSYMPTVGAGIADPALEIDTKLSAGSYAGFQPWTIGTRTARYVKQKIVLDTSIGTPVISGFRPTVDSEEFTQLGEATVPPGGTTITFPQRFHVKPLGGASVIGTTGLIAVVSNVTATGFDVSVVNTSLVNVGGNITWDFTGA